MREGNICCHSSLVKGNVEAGFEGSDHIFEDVFSTESVHQSHLEPRVAVAVVDSAGQVTVYSNTQLFDFNIQYLVKFVLFNLKIKQYGKSRRCHERRPQAAIV